MWKQSTALKHLFMGKRYLPQVFRRPRVPVSSAAGTENRESGIFSYWTKKSMTAKTPEQLIYSNASVNSAFVRDLEDAMSETTLSLDSFDCGSQARSIFTQMSLFFDTENTVTYSFEESDCNDEVQSVGCAGLGHFFFIP
ncbi:hypothetical protein ACHAW5_005721 [Stephanodiscus triporus]|uniref:Uncharacterized protein n=1 Tax=Stephanodiscus triporus TaxID=2934178 RepID=A0ABD3NQ05_9STRA